MKFSRILNICTLSLIATPVAGQFGLPKVDKEGSSFEELNELMKARGADGEDPMANMQKMMADLMNDPKMMDAFKDMGQDLEKAMDQMAQMKPEEIQSQMEAAMNMLTNGDIAETIMGKKDEVLASLKSTGLVSDEELAKYEADPAYFEEQIRGSFDQMKDIFANPDVINNAQNAMAGIGEAMKNPLVSQIQQLLVADTVTDVQIEELRLMLVEDPEAYASNPILSTMFMDEALKESIKSTDAFKEQMLDAREKVQEIMNTGMIPGMENLMQGLGGAAEAEVGATGDIGIGAA